MKVKRFNANNCSHARPGKPTINFNKKGPISISKTAVQKLNVSPETPVAFLQDEENPKDWYITVGGDKDGFKVRYAENGACIFNSSYLSQTLLRSLGISTNSSFLIATEPTELFLGQNGYAIITKSATARI